MIRAMLRWDDCAGSGSTRGGPVHFFGSEAGLQALEAGRTMLMTGGSRVDVLWAVNRAGAAVYDPVRPSFWTHAID